jgi:hypothetical protein
MQTSLFGSWPPISAVLLLAATAVLGTVAAARTFRWE